VGSMTSRSSSLWISLQVCSTARTGPGGVRVRWPRARRAGRGRASRPGSSGARRSGGGPGAHRARSGPYRPGRIPRRSSCSGDADQLGKPDRAGCRSSGSRPARRGRDGGGSATTRARYRRGRCRGRRGRPRPSRRSAVPSRRRRRNVVARRVRVGSRRWCRSYRSAVGQHAPVAADGQHVAQPEPLDLSAQC